MGEEKRNHRYKQYESVKKRSSVLLMVLKFFIYLLIYLLKKKVNKNLNKTKNGINIWYKTANLVIYNLVKRFKK